MSEHPFKRPYSPTGEFLLMLAAAFLLILKYGYNFMISDQTEYFLKPLMILNPHFAINDWYTWKTATPDLHSNFTQLILLLNKLSQYNIPLETSIFSLWALFVIFLVYSIRRLCDALTSDYRVFWIASCLIFFNPERTWGGYKLFYNMLIPSQMVVPVFILSLAFMAEKRYWLAGLFWGLSSVVHVAYGITGIFIYGSYLILRPERAGFKDWLRFAGGFLLLGSPAVISTVYSFIYQADKLSRPEDYKIFLFRSPHHFVPSSWGPGVHLKMLVIISLALYSARFSRYKLKHDILLWFSLSVLIFLGIAAFFTEVVFNSYILRLFFWRFAPYITLTCYIYGASLILDMWDRHDSLSWLGTGSLFLIYLFIGIPSRVYNTLTLLVLAGFLMAQWLDRLKVNKRLVWAGYISGLVSAVAFSCLPKFFPALFPDYELQSLTQVNIYGFLLSAMLMLAAAFASDKYRLKTGVFAIFAVPFITLHLSGINQIKLKVKDITSSHKYEKNYEEVLDWAKHNTKPEDNFIIPPGLEGFTIRTGRGQMVSLKCVPSKGYELREWKNRIDKLAGYDNLAPGRVKELASEYGAAYFVAPKPHKNEATFLAYRFVNLFQNERYIIYRIPA